MDVELDVEWRAAHAVALLAFLRCCSSPAVRLRMYCVAMLQEDVVLAVSQTNADALLQQLQALYGSVDHTGSAMWRACDKQYAFTRDSLRLRPHAVAHCSLSLSCRSLLTASTSSWRAIWFSSRRVC